MTTFSERVIKIAIAIPKGRVTTYGRIADAAGGGPMSSLGVTSILGKAAREGKKIPFHRIVYGDGRVWIDEKHSKARLALYKKEKIELDKNNRIKNFREILIEYK